MSEERNSGPRCASQAKLALTMREPAGTWPAPPPTTSESSSRVMPVVAPARGSVISPENAASLSKDAPNRSSTWPTTLGDLAKRRLGCPCGQSPAAQTDACDLASAVGDAGEPRCDPSASHAPLSGRAALRSDARKEPWGPHRWGLGGRAPGRFAAPDRTAGPWSPRSSAART